MRRRLWAFAACVVVATVLCPLLAGAGALPEEEAFKRIVTYKIGDDADADALNRIEALVVGSHGKPEVRKAIEGRLIAILRSKETTTDCKRFVCRQLVNAGTARSVPALAALLPDEELSHMGLYALARMPYPEAGKALRDALGKLEGKPLVGVINALGARRDRRAIPALASLLKSSDAMVAEAAIAALGNIGGQASVEALSDAVKANAIKRRELVIQAYLRIADQFLADGDKPAARAIHEALYKPHERVHIRAAALRGLLTTAPDKGVPLLVRALLGDDPAMRAVAIGFVRDVPGAEATKAFAAQVPKLAPEAQVLLLDALADRGDPAAVPAMLSATESKEEQVRVAALLALGQFGDASTVPMFAHVAAGDRKAEADAARQSLHRLRGKGVDEAIVKHLPSGSSRLRVELIKALAARRVSDAVPALLKAAADPDQAVQREAFNALRALADERSLAALVELLLQARDAASRDAAEKAVVALCGKVEDNDKRLAPVLAALPKADRPAKVALLRTLGKFGGDKALAAVRAALRDPGGLVQDAAMRSLAGWPDAAPAADLLAIVRTGKSLNHKVLAMRGYVRVLSLPGDRPATEILGKLEEAMSLAPRVDEKKLVLSAVADLRHPAALKMLEPYLDDPQLGAEAKAATEKIKEALKAPARVTASVNANKAGDAIDGKPRTRWDTGTPMKGGEWFIYELPVEHEIRKVVLDTKGSAGDYPRGWEVYISRDGKTWGQPVAKGTGTKPVTEIEFKPTYGRFIKILQTGKTEGLFWSIHEMKVESKLAAP